MSGYTVGEALDRVVEDTSPPRSITVDQGTEFQSFNGRLRDECLNVQQFASIANAQTKIEAWRLDYNQRRPHGSLGHLTPSEFVAQRQVMTTAEAAPV
jgi:putative transposase